SGFPALALTGHAIHDEYAPFDDPNRASRQEFGEVIALGLHYCVRDGGKPREADREFWRAFLPVRRRFLDHLMRIYEERTAKDPDHTRIVTAIRSAQDTFSLITPAFCVAYAEAWLRDRQWWVDY